MAWADPELAVGVAEALTLLVPDVLFVLFVLFAVVPEPPDVLVPDVLVEVDELVAEAVVAAEPGKVRATAPAVTRPAAPTEMVATRSLAIPR